MTAVADWVLECDVPNCSNCTSVSVASAAEARKKLGPAEGWRRSGSKDVCPECWAANGPGRLGWRYTARDGWTVG